MIETQEFHQKTLLFLKLVSIQVHKLRPMSLQFSDTFQLKIFVGILRMNIWFRYEMLCLGLLSSSWTIPSSLGI